MNIQKEFKLLVLPVLKGLPFLLVLLVFTYFIVDKLLGYMDLEYQAVATVKIDNRDHALTDFILFQNENNQPAMGSNFLTEVELFKSNYLQSRALENLDFDVTYQKVGKIKSTELYYERPFTIKYNIFDESKRDKDYYLEFWGKDRFRMYADAKRQKFIKTIKFGKTYTDSSSFSFTVLPNTELIQKKPIVLQPGDFFSFCFNSKESLLRAVNEDNFFVKPVDKDIYVVKLFFNHTVPEKAAIFVNTLANAYLETDQETKSYKASRTLQFIDGEIIRIKSLLVKAEKTLSHFRKTQGLIDTKQETDALLKQINSFDFQKMTLDLKEIELQNLYEYITNVQSLSDFSPDFETINDDILMHTYLKMKNLELELIDLLTKYPESSTEVNAIRGKLDQLKKFTLESIKKKLLNIAEKRKEIQASIRRLQGKFKSFPDKERQLAILQRDFMLNEQTYQYLTKKRTEFGIVQSSKLSFHRVIDYATVPTSPIAPNRSLLLGAALMLVTLIALGFIYLFNFFLVRVSSKEEVEELLKRKIFATVGKVKKNALNPMEPFLNLYANLNNLGLFEGGKTISISSIKSSEGKTLITASLGKLLASFGKNVLLIDMNMVNPGLHESFQLKNTAGVDLILEKGVQAHTMVRTNGIPNLFLITAGSKSEAGSTMIFSPKTKSFLDTMSQEYDVVLIDTAATSKRIDAAAVMRHCDGNLFVIRNGRNRRRRLFDDQLFVEEYDIPNINFIFNQG